MKKALYIERSIFFQKIVKDLLSSFGYNLITATMGDDAINILKSESIDLVLTAYVLDDMSAVDFIKKMNESHLNNQPIVLISSYDEVRDIKDLFKMGISEYILKKDIHDLEVTKKVFKNLVD